MNLPPIKDDLHLMSLCQEAILELLDNPDKPAKIAAYYLTLVIKHRKEGVQSTQEAAKQATNDLDLLLPALERVYD